MCPLYLVVENMSHFITGRKYVYFFIGRKSVRRKSVRRKSVRRKNVRRKNVPVPTRVRWWLWEEIHVLKVVGSNLSTIYWMDIFSQIFVVKIVMVFV